MATHSIYSTPPPPPSSTPAGCPKTAGNRSRRVLFGWLNNGWNQGGAKAAPDQPGNNTLTLPRDLTASAAGQLRQRFVPELRRLRRNHTHLPAAALRGGGGVRPPTARTAVA
eukprot:SAG11_NODE_16399_length_548_cov_1.035635_1_plen_112_part_00